MAQDKRLYVITVEGDVAVIAQLTESEAQTLRDYVENQREFARFNVVASDVTTSYGEAEAALEAALDIWR
jgi:hypothetical protein